MRELFFLFQKSKVKVTQLESERLPFPTTSSHYVDIH